MGVVERARRNRHVLCLMLHHCNNNYFVRCPLPSSFVWLAADRPGRMLARDGREHGDGRRGSSYLIASAQRPVRDNEDVGMWACGRRGDGLVWLPSQPPQARAKTFSNTFSSGRRKANAHMGVTTKVPFYTSNPSTNTPATPKLTNLVITLCEW